MSTDRPKRNIIKKKYDISDGMPWCEERLVRKVLFLSLREFRDTHRATHKHSHLHTHGHKNKRKTKNTLSRTHSPQNMHISKHLHPHEHTDKVQKTKLSQDSHTLQNMQTQSKMCTGKITLQHAQLQEKHTFQKNSVSTRTLRSHKTHNTLSLLNSKYTYTAKHTHSAQHKHSVKDTSTPENTQMLPNARVPARTLRSHTPTSLSGSLVNGISRCHSLLSANPTWSWSLQTRPQQRYHAAIHRNNDDPGSKRPRLQAQRKFAQSPPSSPGPPVLMTSARCNHTHNMAVVTCLTRRRPKTEDFLSFLCLRGSAALPSNMAFLASGREKELAGTQHLPSSCLSTNHRTATKGKNMSIFNRTTEQRGSRSLRGRPRGSGSAAGSSFYPLTARAQRRRDREMREEEQQRRRRQEMEDRREGAKRHLLRPRQLSLQVGRTNKVATVTRLSEHRSSCVRSVPPLKPSIGVGSRRSPGPCKAPSNTCKPRGNTQSRAQEPNSKRFSQHNNHQLPRNQRLPLNHQTVSNYYSKPKTFSSLQNSGRNSSRTHIPLTNGSVIRQLKGNPGVLRLSRRRRGLPPDTSQTPLNQFHLDKNSSKKCNNGDVPVESDCPGETPQKEAKCDEDVGEECVNHMGKTSGSHDEDFKQDRSGDSGEMSQVRCSCVTEDIQDKVNVGKLCLASVTALEPCQDRVNHTNDITNYDLSPVCEAICRHVGNKRLQRNQPASSTTPKTITRTTVSRTAASAATAMTTVTKAAINSATSTSIHSNPPASYSAKHTAKGIQKGTSKDIIKCTLPASSYSIHNSRGAAKDSSKATIEDSTKDSSYLSTSKGSTKRLSQTKSTTSAIKTRTSPRILLKH